MSTVFVIQPFDTVFNKRFTDVFKPAIEATGLKAYRVDEDPETQVVIEAIEKGIENAKAVLCDITTDRPNVWYELGFAFAKKKPVVLVCASSRAGSFPFDIQHRQVIKYEVDSAQDFELLQAKITEKLATLISLANKLRDLGDTEPGVEVAGLSYQEIALLTAVGSSVGGPSETVYTSHAKETVERSGLAPIGYVIGLRRLLRKAFIEEVEVPEEYGNVSYTLRITDMGWDWIEHNEAHFSKPQSPAKKNLRRSAQTDDDDIPF